MNSDQLMVALSDFGIRLAINTIAHPLEYAKVLMQMGHEPLPPYKTTTLLGRPAYAYPNVFKYVKYIKQVDGFTGCYRGFTSRMTAHVVGTCALKYSYSKFKPCDEPNEDTSEEEKRNKFCYTLVREVSCKSFSIIVSHPFHVVTLRMMAQFVGGEDKYSGILGSLLEIYREQGILGFFAGIIPRWLGEIATLVIASTLTFTISSYVIQDSDIKSFAAPAIQYMTGVFTYPFSVVTSCMAVNNCGLAAGLPPSMPVYRRWTECWAHLSRTGQLNRGASPLWRYNFNYVPSTSKILSLSPK